MHTQHVPIYDTQQSARTESTAYATSGVETSYYTSCAVQVVTAYEGDTLLEVAKENGITDVEGKLRLCVIRARL